MLPLWNQLKSGQTQEERKFNNKLLKTSRTGDYLVKSACKYACQAGIGYVDYSFRDNGSIPCGKRKNAQWFTKKETAELTKGWIGFRVIKR